MPRDNHDEYQSCILESFGASLTHCIDRNYIKNGTQKNLKSEKEKSQQIKKKKLENSADIT